MAICGCTSSQCYCRFSGGFGVEVTGNGTTRQPYKAVLAPWALLGSESSSAEVTVAGAGTGGDPWDVSVDVTGLVSQTVFEADGPWVKPTAGSVAWVVVIGGGGGGGKAGAANAVAAGSGGNGGAMSTGWFLLADLPDSVDCKVGQGGPGALAGGATTQGVAGGDSWFGDFLFADGGIGGTHQGTNPTPQVITPGGTAPEGGHGGYPAVRDGLSFLGAEDHLTLHSPTGGGLGDGNTVAATPGGVIFPTETKLAGEGGAGAASTAVPGTDGGLYGGGGGGGACQTTPAPQFSSGGYGGNGVVIVTVW